MAKKKKLIEASEAYLITKDNNKVNYDNCFRLVTDTMNRAIRKGLYYTEFKNAIIGSMIFELLVKGYKMYTVKGESGELSYLISWGKDKPEILDRVPFGEITLNRFKEITHNESEKGN